MLGSGLLQTGTEIPPFSSEVNLALFVQFRVATYMAEHVGPASSWLGTDWRQDIGDIITFDQPVE